MSEETKPPASSHKRPKKRTEKGPKGNVASQKIADAVGAAAKTISIHSVSKPNGGHEPRRQSGEKRMSEHKENGSVFEGLTSNLNIEGAKKFAAWYIDTTEKVAKQAIDFQASGHQVGEGNPARSDFRRADRIRQKVRRALRQRRPQPLAHRITVFQYPKAALPAWEGVRVRFRTSGLSRPTGRGLTSRRDLRESLDS